MARKTSLQFIKERHQHNCSLKFEIRNKIGD